ncbi:hypothetical protein C8R44DRAFT_885811 [Mycena epipterygia]|nr:hypothetical protein C8R44DRAFT_885811 [Mycena epipterygia]
MSVLLSDLMVMYRLWVISNRNKFVIALPTLTLLGVTVCGIILVINARNARNIALVVSLTPLFVFTLVTSFYCTVISCPAIYQIQPHRNTGAIFWRLWTITKDFTPTPDGKHSNIRDFIFMIIESAAVYTSWALIYAVLHQIDSPVQYIFFTALPPLGGIANALIQVRMALGKAIEPPATAVSTAPLRFVVGNSQEATHVDNLEMKSMGV